jgi:hypothetical protein
MQSFETSKPAKCAEGRRRDHRPPAARQSRQRKIEHRAKTPAGKARAAQNAVRHGLNVPVLSDPSLAPEVEAIARRISGLYENGETLEWARRIAEAQVDLTSLRNSRRQLIGRLFVDPAYQPAQVYRRQLRGIKMVLGNYRPRTLPINADAIMDMLSPETPSN